MNTYAISDLHGRLDLWNQVKEYLEYNDTVYFLGDAIDRGPDGWELMKELIEDKRVIYICGNHEDMLIKAVAEMKQGIGPNNCGSMSDFYLWYYYNGGYTTYNHMIQDSEWGKWIDKLQEKVCYQYHLYYSINDELGKIILCHAGYTPYLAHLDNENRSLKDLMWDRKHIRLYPKAEELAPNTIIVHGHTPTIYLIDEYLNNTARWNDKPKRKWESGAIWYCHNQKVDIDCGSFATGITCLLNLKDWTENIFTAEPDYSFF